MSKTSPPEAISYVGGGFSILSSLTLTDVGILVGIATAILTFLANLVYTFRKDRREQLETEARLKAMEDANDIAS